VVAVYDRHNVQVDPEIRRVEAMRTVGNAASSMFERIYDLCYNDESLDGSETKDCCICVRRKSGWTKRFTDKMTLHVPNDICNMTNDNDRSRRHHSNHFVNVSFNKPVHVSFNHHECSKAQ
jgi:hypothetical protein